MLSPSSQPGWYSPLSQPPTNVLTLWSAAVSVYNGGGSIGFYSDANHRHNRFCRLMASRLSRSFGFEIAYLFSRYSKPKLRYSRMFGRCAFASTNADERVRVFVTPSADRGCNENATLFVCSWDRPANTRTGAAVYRSAIVAFHQVRSNFRSLFFVWDIFPTILFRIHYFFKSRSSLEYVS